MYTCLVYTTFTTCPYTEYPSLILHTLYASFRYINVLMICCASTLAQIMSRLFAMQVSFYANVNTQHLDKLACQMGTTFVFSWLSYIFCNGAYLLSLLTLMILVYTDIDYSWYLFIFDPHNRILEAPPWGTPSFWRSYIASALITYPHSLKRILPRTSSPKRS